MEQANEKLAPIRQSVHVDAPVEDTFRLFTEGFTEWWPRASHSITGEESEHCAIEPWVGGKIVERSRSGEEQECGSVTSWDPPRRVEFTWHPGTQAETGQTVTVDFRVEGEGTRVTLTHRGWHRAGVAICESFFTLQWSAILELCFAPFVLEQMLVTA